MLFLNPVYIHLGIGLKCLKRLHAQYKHTVSCAGNGNCHCFDGSLKLVSSRYHCFIATGHPNKHFCHAASFSRRVDYIESAAGSNPASSWR